MTKFGLAILQVLNDNDVSTSSKAFSISRILELIPDKQRKSYSTTYRHLQNMVTQGYIKCGFSDGMASTYFIGETGKSLCKAQEEF